VTISAGLAHFTLPVSGIGVTLRHPTGIEDLLLLESRDDQGAALMLARELATANSGEDISWLELTPTDLDVLILRLRQARLGDAVVSDVKCRSGDCGSRVDISFGIEAYLAFHQPKTPRGRSWHVLACADEAGWYQLSDREENPIRFRLPTIANQISAMRQRDPESALMQVCIRPVSAESRMRGRIEAAMQAMAPILTAELQGVCPECGTAITVEFRPRSYCLQELRDRARFTYEDVDLLATRYRWAEHSILAMPNIRRESYVEFALSGTA
jgi:hypothetical protein